jgi:Zn-dependent M28 family amino/carboxypeptidase
MKHKRNLGIGVFLFVFILVAGLTWLFYKQARPGSFNAERAYQDVLWQVKLGPRTPGTAAHSAAVTLIKTNFESAGWKVEIQETSLMGHPIQNIIAKRSDVNPVVILGAHYDSRIIADHDLDPKKQQEGVPGANDGASGVAVLLELARVLPQDSVPVWLVFFDAEDNGDIQGWDWTLGSRAFADSLTTNPQAVVVVDMIGDKDLQIFQEGFSDKVLSAAIWKQASELGYVRYFIPQVRHTILDDHKPFLDRGIPAVDIIDIDYKYWHTTQDTPDKVSAESLRIVGDTLLAWLKTLKP